MKEFKNILKKAVRATGKAKENVKAAVFALLAAYMASPAPVYADEVTAPITKLGTVMLSILSAIGIIIIIFGVVKLSAAFHAQNPNEERSAGFTIGAGAILLSAGIIIATLTS